MVYLTLEDYFNIIFKDIRELVYDDIEKPMYENHKDGLKKLESTLESIKNDYYYPTYYQKLAYLFLNLSRGHCFDNGNKRIAIYSFMYFVYLNKYRYRNIQKISYQRWFLKHFPKYKLEYDEFYTNWGWALFNFNKAINIRAEEKDHGHEYSFNELKKITENFFKFILRKK